MSETVGSEYANEVDDLLAAFQQACVHVHFANDISKATKERAILRNDIRARLLAAHTPDKPDDSRSAP